MRDGGKRRRDVLNAVKQVRLKHALVRYGADGFAHVPPGVIKYLPVSSGVAVIIAQPGEVCDVISINRRSVTIAFSASPDGRFTLPRLAYETLIPGSHLSTERVPSLQ